MTPTDEIAALRRVVEALHDVAAKMEKLRGRINALPCNVSDALLNLGEAREMLDRIVDIASRALPAASPTVVGETVDIRAVCLRAIADKLERVPKPRSYEMARYCMGLEDAAMAIRDKIAVRLALIPTTEEPK